MDVFFGKLFLRRATNQVHGPKLPVSTISSCIRLGDLKGKLDEMNAGGVDDASVDVVICTVCCCPLISLILYLCLNTAPYHKDSS